MYNTPVSFIFPKIQPLDQHGLVLLQNDQSPSPFFQVAMSAWDNNPSTITSHGCGTNLHMCGIYGFCLFTATSNCCQSCHRWQALLGQNICRTTNDMTLLTWCHVFQIARGMHLVVNKCPCFTQIAMPYHASCFLLKVNLSHTFQPYLAGCSGM